MNPKTERLLERLTSMSPSLVGGRVGNDVEDLVALARRLISAIETHRAATGHEMCWENDEELWKSLEDGVAVDHTPPPWCEFMEKCAAYRASKDKNRR